MPALRDAHLQVIHIGGPPLPIRHDDSPDRHGPVGGDRGTVIGLVLQELAVRDAFATAGLSHRLHWLGPGQPTRSHRTSRSGTVGLDGLADSGPAPQLV